MATIPELLDRKRWGGRLTRDELDALVGGYVRGEVPDYQVSAWLMAVCCQGDGSPGACRPDRADGRLGAPA